MSSAFEDKRINEALQLLNEVAKDKKDELSEVIHSKYDNLRSAVGGAAGKMQHNITAGYHQGVQAVRGAAEEVDESVHKNPWPYIGGVALGALIIGYLMGRSKRS